MKNNKQDIEECIDDVFIYIWKSLRNPENNIIAILRIIADENRNEYSITAEFKGLNKDPLSLECIDELGLSIVKAYSSSLNSSCINGIWQINATI